MCDRGILEKIRNNKIHENNEPKNRVLMDFIFYSVVSTKRGMELLITGISLGTTRFLLLIAIAVWNSISFIVWSSPFFNKFSTSSHKAVIFLYHRKFRYIMILFSLYNLNTREHILTLSFYHKRYNDDKIKKS